LTQTFEQVPFADAEFADNAEPRVACLLLLDTSGSMSGEPIAELNEGIARLKEALMADAMAMKRVEVGIVTFGPVQTVAEFHTADQFHPPALSAGGNTPMGQAIEHGLTMLESRKAEYKRNGILYYRPWVFLVTDGAPTDSWSRAADRVHAGEESKAFAFYAVGVRNANMKTLEQIAVREPLRLDGIRFADMFLWLSNSMSRVSSSRVGDTVPLDNPAGPKGWAKIE